MTIRVRTFLSAALAALLPAAPVLALRVAVPGGGAGALEDAAVRSAAVAELEVTALQPATAEREGVVQFKVKKQAGLTPLPERFHVILPKNANGGQADPSVPSTGIRRPVDWVSGLAVGRVLWLPVNPGEGGRPWTVEGQAGNAAPAWPGLEAVFAARKQLEGLTGEARDKRIGELIASGRAGEIKLGLSHLPEEGDFPAAVVAALANVDVEAFYRVVPRYDQRTMKLLAAALQGRTAKDLIAVLGRPVTGGGGQSHTIAREALIAKAHAGDADALAYWKQQFADAKNAAQLTWPARGLANATGDKATRDLFIAKLTGLGPNDTNDIDLIAGVINGGPEGFDYIVDCLVGKVKLTEKRFGGARVMPHSAQSLRQEGRAAKLIAMLGDADANLRAFGAYGLAGIKHAPAAGKLNALFDKADEPELVRAAAAMALTAIGGETTLAFCRKVLALKEKIVLTYPLGNRANGRMDVQDHALYSLGKADTPEIVALLVKFINDQPADDAAAAAPLGGNGNVGVVVALPAAGGGKVGRVGGSPAHRAIQMLGQSKLPAAAEALAEIAIKSKPPRAEWAVEALLTNKTPAAAAAIARVAAEGAGEAKAKAAKAVGGTAGAEAVIAAHIKSRDGSARTPELIKTIKALVADLDSDEFAVREAATTKLAGLGAAARPEVLEALKSPAPERVTRAKQILASVDDPSALTAVAEALAVCRSAQHAGLAADLLEAEPLVVRALAIDGLVLLTGKSLDYDPFAPDAARKAAVERWRAEIKAGLKPAK